MGPERMLTCECGAAEPGHSCGRQELATNMRLVEIDSDGRVRDPQLGGRREEGWRQIYVLPSCADRILAASSRRAALEPELGFTD
jgi:hypothetical protein